MWMWDKSYMRMRRRRARCAIEGDASSKPSESSGLAPHTANSRSKADQVQSPSRRWTFLFYLHWSAGALSLALTSVLPTQRRARPSDVQEDV